MNMREMVVGMLVKHKTTGKIFKVLSYGSWYSNDFYYKKADRAKVQLVSKENTNCIIGTPYIVVCANLEPYKEETMLVANDDSLQVFGTYLGKFVIKHSTTDVYNSFEEAKKSVVKMLENNHKNSLEICEYRPISSYTNGIIEGKM